MLFSDLKIVMLKPPSIPKLPGASVAPSAGFATSAAPPVVAQQARPKLMVHLVSLGLYLGVFGFMEAQLRVQASSVFFFVFPP